MKKNANENMPPFLNPADDPRVQDLRSAWNNLRSFDKGDAIKQLIAGYGLKSLAAPVLPCGEKRLRDLVILSFVPTHLRQDCPFGNKEILRAGRVIKRASRTWRSALKGHSGRHLKDRLHGFLVHWCRAQLQPAHWDKFMYECLWTPCVAAEIFRLPNNWYQLTPCDNWEQRIESTRPPGEPDSGQYENPFSYWELWLSRWYMQCIPDPVCAIGVFERAKRTLRRMSKRMKLDGKSMHLEESWIDDLASSCRLSAIGLPKRPWCWLSQKAPGIFGIQLAWLGWPPQR